jgi:hypothetical protein
MDSEMQQGMIVIAWEWIFIKGQSVASKVIDRFINFSIAPHSCVFFLKIGYICGNEKVQMLNEQ